MNKKLKILIFILSAIIIILISIFTFIVTKHVANKKIIDQVINTFTDEQIQERLENFNNEDNTMAIEFDDETIIGVIRIDKIKFEGLIYDGTSLDTLSKGVGHFKSSPYINGNVCLAAHNTRKYWAKLHTLKIGDSISYISLLGSKEYTVDNIQEISENDLSLLENTDENRITLITCIYKNPTKRLCVQAIEK